MVYKIVEIKYTSVMQSCTKKANVMYTGQSLTSRLSYWFTYYSFTYAYTLILFTLFPFLYKFFFIYFFLPTPPKRSDSSTFIFFQSLTSTDISTTDSTRLYRYGIVLGGHLQNYFITIIIYMGNKHTDNEMTFSTFTVTIKRKNSTHNHRYRQCSNWTVSNF